MAQLIYPREMLDELLSKIEVVDSARLTELRLVDAVFFASLLLEEGEHVPLAIVHAENGCAELAEVEDSELPGSVFDQPRLAWRTTQLTKREFNPTEIIKLARGLRYGSQVIVAAGREPDLWIDGFARREPGTDGGAVTLIAAPRPGVLVFEQEGHELLHYDNGRKRDIALPILWEKGPVQVALEKIVGVHAHSASWVVSTLLREMRAAKAGGLLAILPSRPVEPILEAIKYRPVDRTLLSQAVAQSRNASIGLIAAAPTGDVFDFDYIEAYGEAREQQERARGRLLAVLEDLGALSAVDGALLLGPDLEVYGAGHFVHAANKATPPEPLLARDVEGAETEAETLNVGARHRAAFTCAFEYLGSVVFIISEDGPVRCVMRKDDSLLLWPVHLPI